MQRRRTIRQFSDRPVAESVIAACVEAAGTAPSGAHQQPWHFVVISDAGDQAGDTRRRGGSGGGVLCVGACRMAGRPRAARDRQSQAVSRDRAVPHCGLCGAIRNQARRGPPDTLLRLGVRRDRHGVPAGGVASRRVGDAHPHPQPDGLPLGDPRATGKRKGGDAGGGRATRRQTRGCRISPGNRCPRSPRSADQVASRNATQKCSSGSVHRHATSNPALRTSASSIGRSYL